MSEMMLLNHIDEFVVALKAKIKEDENYWNFEFVRRSPIKQETKWFPFIQGYYNRYRASGSEMPWLEIATIAMLCWARLTIGEDKA